VWAVAGCVDDDDPEVAGVERRTSAGDQRAVNRVGVVGHQHDGEMTVLAP
jgi:hypothetical protein